MMSAIKIWTQLQRQRQRQTQKKGKDKVKDKDKDKDKDAWSTTETLIVCYIFRIPDDSSMSSMMVDTKCDKHDIETLRP